MASSSSDSSLALTNGRQSVSENKPLGSSSPLRSSSPVMAEEEERLDSETENMLSPLADSLLQNDSKILKDNEIDEVLNEENFSIFSTGKAVIQVLCSFNKFNDQTVHGIKGYDCNKLGVTVYKHPVPHLAGHHLFLR